MSIDSSTEKTFFSLFFAVGLGKGIFQSRRQQRIKPSTPVINEWILLLIIKDYSNSCLAEYGVFTEETEQEYTPQTQHPRPCPVQVVGQGTLFKLSKSHLICFSASILSVRKRHWWGCGGRPSSISPLKLSQSFHFTDVSWWKYYQTSYQNASG